MAGNILRGMLVLAMVFLIAAAARIAAQSDEAQRIQESMAVFSEIMAAPDKAIPNSVLGKAEGIAIFPGTIKGGFVIGAQHGRGVLSAREQGPRAWSATAFMSINGGTL